MKKKPICSICQKEIQPDDNGWDGTNNAWPVNEGVCCHSCDSKVVLPARLNQYYSEEKQNITITKQSKEASDE